MIYRTSIYGDLPMTVHYTFRGLIYQLNLDIRRMRYECFEMNFTVDYYLSNKNKFRPTIQ